MPESVLIPVNEQLSCRCVRCGLLSCVWPRPDLRFARSSTPGYADIYTITSSPLSSFCLHFPFGIRFYASFRLNGPKDASSRGVQASRIALGRTAADGSISRLLSAEDCFSIRKTTLMLQGQRLRICRGGELGGRELGDRRGLRLDRGRLPF